MVMLHNFLLQIDKNNLAVVTVNHNLRKAGKNDAKFVFDYCTKSGIKCIVKNVYAAQHAKTTKQSIETAARQLRYEAIKEEADNFDFICLAHHAGDNAETVLLHLLRGGGMRGASGIRTFYGKFFRPLLNVTKQEITQYIKQNNIPFVTDETNALSDCKRNFLRNIVFPQLKEITKNAVQALNNFALLATQDDEYLNSLADISGVKFLSHCATMPINLLFQPRPIASRILFKVFRNLGLVKDIENKHINDIIKICQNSEGTSTIHLPFCFKAIREYDTLIIVKEDIINRPILEVLPLKLGETSFSAKTVNISKDKPQNTKRKILRADWDKIPPNALLRTRREGDVFTKFGGGTKKLKDFLIDKKIPLNNRDNLIVIAEKNEIYAIFGVEISDKIKIDSTTKSTVFLY